jgi:Fe-S-cluster containining protein
MSERRCTGHCCRCFPLPKTPAELASNYAAFLAGEMHENGKPLIQDIEKIAPMVIPLGSEQVYADGSKSQYYTCKHLQENGDCANYANRPLMCSEYPYGKPCRYAGAGCTLYVLENNQ